MPIYCCPAAFQVLIGYYACLSRAMPMVKAAERMKLLKYVRGILNKELFTQMSVQAS